MQIHICPLCQKEFIGYGRYKRKYCSRSCANKAPGHISQAGREALRQSKLGNNNPTKRPEIGQKISKRLKEFGPKGSQRHDFKGGWIAKSKDRKYFKMWLDPTLRGIYLTVNKRGYISRAHYVWNQAHPNDMVKKGEIIHHINNDSLDDRLENLIKLPSQNNHAFLHYVPFHRQDRKHSPEHNAKISAGLYLAYAEGRRGPKNPLTGRFIKP